MGVYGYIHIWGYLYRYIYIYIMHWQVLKHVPETKAESSSHAQRRITRTLVASARLEVIEAMCIQRENRSTSDLELQHFGLGWLVQINVSYYTPILA